MRSQRLNYAIVGVFVLAMGAMTLVAAVALSGRSVARDSYFIVLDNVANDRYQPILESLKNLSDQGVAVKKALKESGLEGLQMDSTPEERTLNEILERGARRGILDRIDIHGLPARDIVELLQIGRASCRERV